MYSTLDGAKKSAKQLKRLLDDHGLIYTLAKCQTAVAKAGGYRDWHDLTTRIASRPDNGLPFDYWGRLLVALPDPCARPVRSHLRHESTPGAEKWIAHVVPYAANLTAALRKHAPHLRPGSGRDQRLRLEIVGGLLLNVEGASGFSPKLDPDALTIVLDAMPQAILPRLGEHPRFDQALDALAAAGIVKVESGSTFIFAPDDPEIRAGIIAAARRWKSQQKPQVEYIEMTPELAAALKHQANLDRAEAGPKVPYDELDYRGVQLGSRYAVAHEFEAMKAVVDAISEQVRLRIESIWCDSKAGAEYRVVVRLGMFHSQLPELVRAGFLAASDGFNGLWVWHGSETHGFDPEWPGEFDDFHDLIGASNPSPQDADDWA